MILPLAPTGVSSTPVQTAVPPSPTQLALNSPTEPQVLSLFPEVEMLKVCTCTHMYIYMYNTGMQSNTQLQLKWK